MSEHVQKLLTLYDNGIIDGDALNNALKALNNAPQASQAQEKTLIDKVREKRRRKKKLRKQRKAIAEKQKNVINELKEKIKVIESPFRLVDKTKCGYLRAHEISVKRYKDPVKMFQDKKSTIKNKITAELQELTRLKWSFGLTVDFFKDDKKIKGTFPAINTPHYPLMKSTPFLVKQPQQLCRKSKNSPRKAPAG